MNYKDIEIFLEVVRTGNITKTADNLFLSQSTVSKRLQNLEDELCGALMVRHKGHRIVELTKKGEDFVPVAERWRQLYEETETLKTKTHSVIRIATNESTYIEILNPFLIKFYNHHKDIRLSVLLGDSEPIYDMVEKKLADFGFASYEAMRQNVHKELINEQETCIVQYSEKPIEGLTIHPSELNPEKEIRFTGGHFDTLAEWHKKWFDGKGDSRLSINSARAMTSLLKELSGWALYSLEGAKLLAKEISLQIYHLEEDPPIRKLYMLKSSNSNLESLKACEIFEDELKEYLNSSKTY